MKERKLGIDDNASTLATQDTLIKKLVYVTNIQEEIKGTTYDTCNDGKNSSEYEDKKPAARTRPLEKSSPTNPNDKLKRLWRIWYRKKGREKEWKKKAKKMKEVIHIEFDMDNDKDVQPKNAYDGKTEGKVQVKKKTIHYYEFSSENES